MRAAKELLALAEARFPSTPLPGLSEGYRRRHSLSLDPLGNTLILTIVGKECWHTFNLDDADLDGDPARIIDDVEKLMPLSEARWAEHKAEALRRFEWYTEHEAEEERRASCGHAPDCPLVLDPGSPGSSGLGCTCDRGPVAVLVAGAELREGADVGGLRAAIQARAEKSGAWAVKTVQGFRRLVVLRAWVGPQTCDRCRKPIAVGDDAWESTERPVLGYFHAACCDETGAPLPT